MKLILPLHALPLALFALAPTLPRPAGALVPMPQQSSPSARAALFRGGRSVSVSVSVSGPSSALSVSTYASRLDDGSSSSEVGEAATSRYGPEVTFGNGLKLNLFGFVYGTVAISMGLVWWMSMTLCQLIYKLTGNRVDRLRRWPVSLSQLWGVTLMRLMGCFPRIEGAEELRKIYEANKGKRREDRTPVMFVANHCSFMDIPYVAAVIGWRNYKIIAKQELLKVPILSKSIRSSAHVVLDRTNRRSQLNTFKKGVQYLKDGVNLLTFPEGTRSKNSRMGSFKKGAFKMAQKAGAPIVPLSICYADRVQPSQYIFPIRSTRRAGAYVKVGRPIYTDEKSDDEVMEEVWNAVADGLEEEQKPAPGTPVSAL